ncbi:MAG: sensor histidine kinase, partial [Hyphomicrobiales bacterium]|nr:sensor histidine kinase [Hyphomicrobiales bacterium]
MKGFPGSARVLPLTAKVPLAVAALMVVVGALLSHQVISKLGERQVKALEDLSRSYLDGLASAIGPSVLREDNWEVFDAIERAQAGYRTLRPIETVVTNSDDRVIAASDPRRHPIGATYDGRNQAGRIGYDPGGEEAGVSRALAYPGRTAGTIYARFDTRHLASERRSVTIALALTNGLLVLALASAGWLLTRRMLEPVRILSDHLGAAKLSAAEIPEDTVAGAHGEFGDLFRSYNELVRSMHQREDLARR